MKENAPSTPNETPSSSDVLADFQNQRDDLTARVDELENKPGFRMKAEELIQHRQEKKLAKEALSAFATTYAEHGGDAIDEAQKAVDSLNFRSTADDHIKAKAALRDAKDAFHANYMDSQNNDEVAEDIEETDELDDAKGTETTEPSIDTTGTEDVAEAIVEDSPETADDAEREAILADADRLDEALRRSDAAAAERTTDTTDTEESDDTEEDSPEDEVSDHESEDTQTERETRRERREYRRNLKDRAKNIKRIRKEQKKQFDAEARAKVAQDKREQEILNYNRDQQHGIVKKSRIGSIIRRLKNASQKVSGTFKRKRTEDATLSTPDTDAEQTGGRHASGEETPEKIPGEFIEPKAVIRGKERSVVDYNDAMSRVIGGLKAQGLGDFEAAYKPETAELKPLVAKADEKAAKQAKAAAERANDNEEKEAA